jgi:hypothetical protein
MKKILLLAAVVILLLATAAVTAFAGYEWCATDPNIQLPNGRGVAHLIVEVPRAYQDAAFTVEVWAPAGSRVVGPANKNVTVILHADESNPANQLDARITAGLPVRLSVKYRGDQLGAFEFMDGTGDARWVLP